MTRFCTRCLALTRSSQKPRSRCKPLIASSPNIPIRCTWMKSSFGVVKTCSSIGNMKQQSSLTVILWITTRIPFSSRRHSISTAGHNLNRDASKIHKPVSSACWISIWITAICVNSISIRPCRELTSSCWTMFCEWWLCLLPTRKVICTSQSTSTRTASVTMNRCFTRSLAKYTSIRNACLTAPTCSSATRASTPFRLMPPIFTSVQSKPINRLDIQISCCSKKLPTSITMTSTANTGHCRMSQHTRAIHQHWLYTSTNWQRITTPSPTAARDSRTTSWQRVGIGAF